jgi:hypothetical protein
MPRANATKAKVKKSGDKLTPSDKRLITLALKSLPDSFLDCRTYRYHALEQVSLFRWNDGGGKSVCRVSVCRRCGTKREDYFTSKGELMDRRYEFPAGYSLAGHGYLTSPIIMRELFRRSIDLTATPEDAQALARHLSLVETA